jgi:acetyltransferase-like isoleucine patch superfamily enzyme
MLDDRGELIIRKGTSISEHSAVFSHAHDPIDPKIVEHRRTEIGPDARVTYRSVVMPGVHIGEGAVLGAHAVATRDVEENVVAGGVPAKEIEKKDQAKRIDENAEQGRAHEA